MGENLPPLIPTNLVLGLINYERGPKASPPAGVRTTMASFLDEYSLHDSFWMSLIVEPSLNGGDLLIRYDAYWSGGRIPRPAWYERFGKVKDQNPRLIITMSGLVETRFDHEGALIPTILETDCEEHPTLGKKTVTKFWLARGSASLVHDPFVEVRMIDPDGNLIPIPL